MQAGLWRFVLPLFIPFLAAGQSNGQSGANSSAEISQLPGCNYSDLYVRPHIPFVIKKGKAELIRALRPSGLIDTADEIEGICGFAVKPWAYLPSGYIAVFETKVYRREAGHYDDEYRNLAIALLNVPKNTSTFSIVAKTANPEHLYAPNSQGDYEDKAFERFDFAPYRLNENEMAFGLRMSVSITYIGGGGENEFLHLYRIKDGTITPILSTLVKSIWAIRADSGGIEQGAQIRISDHKTNGMFDIEKHFLKDKVKPQMFRWNGKEYVTSDPDPVVDVNKCEINIEKGIGCGILP